MSLKMRTQSAGRPVAKSRGEGMGGRVGRGGGRGRVPRGGRSVGFVDSKWKPIGCSYKEFLACNPKKYDGKGGVVVLTRWIEKMDSVQE
ncbi:hypothetical protein Tco_0209676 [Tanacetum coccineum]